MRPDTRPAYRALKSAATLALAALMIALIGCGGTKVYTVDKTLVYRDELYNLSTVQKITGRQEASLENGQVVSLANKDKDELRDFFDAQDDEVMVSMIVQMDQQEMVYLRMRVEDYGEFSRMQSRFERAMKDINKFMGDKKKTQLRLQ